MKLIYSKMWFFLGREHGQYCDRGSTHVYIRVKNRYTLEVGCMPYTWKLSVGVTWRSDHKSLSIHVLPFFVSIMCEEQFY